MLADIAHSFGLTVTKAGAIAMLSQAGTATGMPKRLMQTGHFNFGDRVQ